MKTVDTQAKEVSHSLTGLKVQDKERQKGWTRKTVKDIYGEDRSSMREKYILVTIKTETEEPV